MYFNYLRESNNVSVKVDAKLDPNDRTKILHNSNRLHFDEIIYVCRPIIYLRKKEIYLACYI